MMRCRCEVWRGVELRSRLNDAFLHVRDHRPDKPVASAGHGLDPAVAAGYPAQHPAQRRNLHRKVAVLDRLARPRRLDQGVLRNHCARALDQGPQQGDRPSPERNRLRSAEQQLVLCVQAERAQRMDRHRGRVLPAFRRFFATFSDRLQDSRARFRLSSGVPCRTASEDKDGPARSDRPDELRVRH
jgi:hypothetical protein